MGNDGPDSTRYMSIQSAKPDAAPAGTIATGKRLDYDFNVSSRGGTYWYHTCAHERTAGQACNGLASFRLVEDDNQRHLVQAMSLTLSVTNLPIVIKDKQFDAGGKLLFRPNAYETTGHSAHQPRHFQTVSVGLHRQGTLSPC